ncbi:amino acid adenylation domain-containing protein, partial [Pseudomonas reidholzensis]|uniref:amino acid adenylation domain-containing protein n=1 Tax=Pseudomonas reidholzensis TaxID=1785162 RepID=UPI003CC64CA0
MAALLKKQGVNLYGVTPIFTRDSAEPLLLSYAQQRLWILSQLGEVGSAYSLSSVLRFKGHLDIAALQGSFEAVIARHETLRTTFRLEGEQAVQVIHPQISFELPVEAFEQTDDASLRARVQAEAQRPFDLELGPLLRARLLRLAADEHVLVLTLHHIVTDGWSMPVMINELVQLYAAHTHGIDTQLPALPIQYADYAIWQRNWMEAGEQERQLAYWTAQLSDEHPVLELPIDRPHPAVPSHQGARQTIDLGEQLVSALKQLAQHQGVTPFMVLLASFQALLHRYSGQADIRVGVPIANRNRVETEGLIGFFVNTQVLRAELDPLMTFSALLQQVKPRALGAQAHQDLPFEQLVEALQVERNLSHSPLFQVMYNHQTQAKGERGSLPGLEMEELAWDSQTAKFDLTLDTFENEQGIGAALTYATDLFDASTIERMARHWLNLLEGIVRQPEQRVADLPLLSQDEQHLIVRDWNRTQANFPGERSIHQLIEAQVEASPDAPALVFGEQTLSYGELNRRANQLAHKLGELGVGPDVLVGIAMERSLEMVIGLLGILKAGGAYVPLDPEYPQDRLSYMFEDSGIALLLTQSHLRDALPIPAGLHTLDLDTGNLTGYSDSNPGVDVAPLNLAYVIYTSGSTGRPKGAGNSHQALVNRLWWMQKAYSLDGTDSVLQKTPFSFDVSVWEFFWPLLTGARLVIAQPGAHRDPQLLVDTINQYGISTLHFVPSMLQAFMTHDAVETCRSLKRVVCSGEALPAELARQTLERLPAAGLYNLYGPTEAAIDVTHWTCRADERISVPIGQPIDNLKTHILEGGLQPVIRGSAGELYLGGVGLARGYHQRPSLTAERFVPDPFSENGGRLYRTGDLARYSAEGVIDYAGRIDHQVKIRGLRIELGEIEARLLELPSVQEAVVLAVDVPSGKQLVGYVVPADATVVDHANAQTQLRDNLREALKAGLPEYMVPAHLLLLGKLPVTPNGKLDRKALPQPDGNELLTEYIAPQTELEQQISVIWADVLKLEKVGLTDNFFMLGGHSLLAVQVISRIRRTLSIDLQLLSLFEARTLAEFAKCAELATRALETLIERISRDQPLALSYAQQRQWFLWQWEPTSAIYNIPAALLLKGKLNIAALKQSFEALIARHETLRSTFRMEGEQAVQVVHQQLPFELVLEASEQVEEGSLRARVQAEGQLPFDLENGPMLRVRLLRLAADEHVLILTVHHIVSDGWSMPVMVNELVRFYEGYSQGLEVGLPPLPIQYADYAIWQRRWMEAGEQERQLAYWTAQLGDEQPVLELPIDRPRPAVASHRGTRQTISLGEQLVSALKQLAQQQGMTPFMVLLASFQALLHRYSGQADIRVGVPIANRNRVETEGLIGFFVNTQVLRAEFDPQMTFSGLLQQVKQRVLGSQAHQDLPFEQLVEALQVERNPSHSPLFQVMYNHQTQAIGERRTLPGLEIEELAWDSQTAKFDLTLDTFEHEQGISAALTYATDLFDASTIERMVRHWLNLLEGIVRQPEQRVADLPLLSQDEQNSILQDWNRTRTSFPDARSIHQLIEAQVAGAPDATALVFGEQALSYGELNRRANQLAHKLAELGVGPDVLVGIAMERSLEMVVGLLGILKAGGAYVPLDPEYPQDRLAYMFEDSGIKLLLTQAHLRDALPIPAGIHCLELDEQSLAGYSEANPAIEISPQNLAYVIYTSGSTGKPKGTLLPHHNVVRLFAATQDWFHFDASDVWTVFHSYAFDFSVWELFGALVYGGKAVMVPRDVARSPEDFHALLIREQVTVLNQTPSAFRQLVPIACEGACDGNRLALRHVVFGGEALDVSSLKPWFEVFGDEQPRLINMYGITETTVHVTYRPITLDDLHKSASSPIGEVIPDLSWYLLEGALNPNVPGTH